MSSSNRRHLRSLSAALALHTMAGAAVAATIALPPLKVDPTLLGLPPLPPSPESLDAPVSAAPAASAAAVAATKAPLPITATPSSPAPKNLAPQAASAPTAAPAATAAVAASIAAPVAATKATKAPAAPQAVVPTAEQPVYVTANHIDGVTGVESVAEGDVDMVRGDRTIKADKLVYREQADEAEATGNVRLTSPGESIAGPHMKLKLGESVGSFDTPAYTLHRLTGKDQTGKDQDASANGTASILNFVGEDKYQLKDATYTTCPATAGDPAWFARVSDLSLDYVASEGVAKGTTIVFKDVPILYSPWMSFTLDNRRKTGLLAPTIGSTSKGGPEYTQPFYWNIAPDMDATIAPRFMAKRGTQWAAEYRYLGQSYIGQVAGEFLENDQITHTNRSALTIKHDQNLGYGFSGSLNLNRVSDDTYFSDLSTRLSNITQTNLLREGRLNYGSGWWSAQLMAQRFQTLQDPSQPPVAIPYDRLPQLVVNADRPDLPFGTELIFSGEYVDFSNPTGTVVEGKRTTLYPQLSYPMQTAAFYVTPKVGFHSTRYQLSQQAATIPDQITRNVPIFSIDSGMVFERPLQLFSQDYTQTLEPRAFYLKVPRRDQTKIPLFDTGLADFNFAQIFSENAYTGNDRISDANQLTLAVTSRMVDAANGEELLRAAVGQRYYFADQTVTIPGVAPRTQHIADLLAALSGKLTREVSLDSGVQYNNQDKEIERLNFGARYQPETGKVFNAGYRYTRALLRQIDTSAQWPLFGGWHAVGRYNYSFRDKRVIESVAGLEYDGGCWASRFVVQRLATAVGQVNNSIFVQLQLNGFSDIGSNPLDILKRNIPGYGQIVQPVADPVFSSQ